MICVCLCHQLTTYPRHSKLHACCSKPNILWGGEVAAKPEREWSYEIITGLLFCLVVLLVGLLIVYLMR